MQQFQVLQLPLCIRKDAWSCRGTADDARCNEADITEFCLVDEFFVMFGKTAARALCRRPAPTACPVSDVAYDRSSLSSFSFSSSESGAPASGAPRRRAAIMSVAAPIISRMTGIPQRTIVLISKRGFRRTNSP